MVGNFTQKQNKKTALDLALEHHKGKDNKPTAEEVVKTAEAFEKFLNGIVNEPVTEESMEKKTLLKG